MKRNGVREQAIDRFLEMMEGVYLQMRPNLPIEWVEGGITTLHFRTLTLLSRGPKRMGDIVADLSISPSTVTRTIDHLLSKELVERVDDPSDRRVVICQLTAKGRQQVLHYWQINRQRLSCSGTEIADALELGLCCGIVKAQRSADALVSARRALPSSALCLPV